MKGLV